MKLEFIIALLFSLALIVSGGAVFFSEKALSWYTRTIDSERGDQYRRLYRFRGGMVFVLGIIFLTVIVVSFINPELFRMFLQS